MATRKIKDAKDLSTNELIYFKGHAKATYMSDGKTVEDAINQIGTGGGGITVETDPIFSASPAATITNGKITEWNNKVDKVSGKQLSTEDFTTALKNKLSGLSNYDDTQINQTIQSLQTQLNTLVSGNTSTAIESFNEIIAFLDGIEDSQSLDSIIASIEQQIASKVESDSLAKVATSGSYNDLNNKPTIPAEQVNADWNATSGKAQILNKPTIPAAVTESTVSGWGFTKNTGTVTKVKVNGVEKSPSSGVVDIGSLVASVKINGLTHTPTNGLVDLGTIESGGGNNVYPLIWDTLYWEKTIDFYLNSSTYYSYYIGDGSKTYNFTIHLDDYDDNNAKEYIIELLEVPEGSTLSIPAVWVNGNPPVFDGGDIIIYIFQNIAMWTKY